MATLSRTEIAAQIAALQAQLDDVDGGVYEDPKTGRWFIVLRPPGKVTTTTRRRAPDGSRLHTREQALIAKGQWDAKMAGGSVATGRERFETFWPRYLRHAKGEMTLGSWEDLRIHGDKRLLPRLGGLQPSKIDVPAVRDWRAMMLEAGEWAPKRSTTPGSRCSAACGWPSRMACSRTTRCSTCARCRSRSPSGRSSAWHRSPPTSAVAHSTIGRSPSC